MEGWVVLLVVAAGTYALKSSGPLLLGNRTLPPKVQRVIATLPAPLLAALVITATFAKAGQLVIDARVMGLATAIVALLAKRGFVFVVVSAALATAVARRFGMA